VKEHKTTFGDIAWDENAMHIEGADDPVSPEGDGWNLVGSAIGSLRFSRQPIFWFWEREKPGKTKKGKT
jgi:hypothetical protein